MEELIQQRKSLILILVRQRQDFYCNGIYCINKFSESLATKCVSLNNEPYMTRPTLIHLNTIETNYYPFPRLE